MSDKELWQRHQQYCEYFLDVADTPTIFGLSITTTNYSRPVAREPKVCVHCGRYIYDRAMTEHNWKQIKYCSSRCCRSARSSIHIEIEKEILRLLNAGREGHTICPSEAARGLFGDASRDHMEDTRRAARRMAHSGTDTILQKGKIVDPGDFKGTIRLAKGPAFPE